MSVPLASGTATTVLAMVCGSAMPVWIHASSLLSPASARKGMLPSLAMKGANCSPRCSESSGLVIEWQK